MVSKTISVTEDMYNKLLEIKGEDESFSQFFLRLLTLYHQKLEKSFGAWKLTTAEKNQIWNDLMKRPSRRWTRTELRELQ